MKKAIVKMFKLSLILSLFSCNAGVNTSDPQASSNIQSSKKDNFFKVLYSCRTDSGVNIKVSEAWVESVWFNKIQDGKAIKEKNNEYQLNLKIDSFPIAGLKKAEYIVKWEMKDAANNTFGAGNGVFILFLQKMIPDSIRISVLRYGNDSAQNIISQMTAIREK